MSDVERTTKSASARRPPAMKGVRSLIGTGPRLTPAAWGAGAATGPDVEPEGFGAGAVDADAACLQLCDRVLERESLVVGHRVGTIAQQDDAPVSRSVQRGSGTLHG